MITIRSLAALLVGMLIALTTGAAFAVPFTPILDEFWIMKGSATAGPTEIFRDSFNDSLPPASGPDGATTYLLSGPGGITSEAGGKLTMTPSLGEPTLITATFADVTTAGLRRLATNAANPQILDQANSFEIHGLFDMSNLPMITGQSFGIRANDRAPDIGYLGNNTFNLFVGVSNITGELGVFLRLNDFALDTSVVLWSDTAIDSLLSGADQIELILSKGASSDMLSASFFLYDYDLTSPILYSASLNNAGALYQAEPGQSAEPFVRAQFISTDQIPIPEPATLALLGLGLAGLSIARRRSALA